MLCSQECGQVAVTSARLALAAALYNLPVSC